jgi:DNA-directed RNA polymerase specialized sigma24 family protein
VRRAERHGKRHQWGDALEALRAARQRLEDCEEEVVSSARADDWTWEEIGRHLGVTGSAVAQRHGGGRKRQRKPQADDGQRSEEES